MIRLTDEEISRALRNQGYTDEVYAELEVVAKAQLKNVVDWGNEPCIEHKHGRRIDTVPRRFCSECWQALLEEIKE